MDTAINLRIDFDLKLELEELAIENNQTLSEYLREQLQEHVDYISSEDDFNISGEKLTLTNEVVYEYEKSFDFTYLLTWLFCKQSHPIDTNSNEAIKAMKNRVELVINESSFSVELKVELKVEFIKVLSDINRFLIEPDYEHKQFIFSCPNHHLSLDYYKLMNEIWSLKH
jgi:hypothetical protein